MTRDIFYAQFTLDYFLNPLTQLKLKTEFQRILSNGDTLLATMNEIFLLKDYYSQTVLGFRTSLDINYQDLRILLDLGYTNERYDSRNPLNAMGIPDPNAYIVQESWSGELKLQYFLTRNLSLQSLFYYQLNYSNDYFSQYEITKFSLAIGLVF
jgi:hypothetical protein